LFVEMDLEKFEKLSSVSAKMQVCDKYIQSLLANDRSITLEKVHFNSKLLPVLNSIEKTVQQSNNFTLIALFNTIHSLEEIIDRNKTRFQEQEYMLIKQINEIEDNKKTINTFKIKVDKLSESLNTTKLLCEQQKNTYAEISSSYTELLEKMKKTKMKKNMCILDLKKELNSLTSQLTSCDELTSIIEHKVDIIKQSEKCNTLENKIMYNEALVLKKDLNASVKTINSLQKKSNVLLKESGLQLENAMFLKKIKTIAVKHKVVYNTPKAKMIKFLHRIDQQFIDNIVPGLCNDLSQMDLANLNKNEKFAIFTFASNYLNDLDLQIFASYLVPNIEETLVSHIFDPIGCFSDDIVLMIARAQKLTLDLSCTRNFIFDNENSYNTFTCVNPLTQRFFRQLALFYVGNLNF